MRKEMERRDGGGRRLRGRARGLLKMRILSETKKTIGGKQMLVSERKKTKTKTTQSLTESLR